MVSTEDLEKLGISIKELNLLRKEQEWSQVPVEKQKQASNKDSAIFRGRVNYHCQGDINDIMEKIVTNEYLPQFQIMHITWLYPVTRTLLRIIIQASLSKVTHITYMSQVRLTCIIYKILYHLCHQKFLLRGSLGQISKMLNSPGSLKRKVLEGSCQ